MDVQARRKLRKFVAKLEKIRGRHTELVSVYIPAGYNLDKIIQHVAQEQGTASNIKDTRTRNNVIDSLERVIRYLRQYKQTPPNGLAVFAGNASETESKVDIQVWGVEPPDELNSRIYRCDQTFMLEPLIAMMEVKEVHGLIVMDRREATFGLLKGTKIVKLHNMTSGVPGKTRAGGQSAQRFERLREGAAKEFFKKIADVANQQFLPLKGDLKGILIGGPIPTKEQFFDYGYLNEELKRKVLGLQDVGDTSESGLRELVERSQDLLAKEAIIEEKKSVEKFLEMLAKHPEKVAYGKTEVEKALEMGAVDLLLLSESLDDHEIEHYELKAEEINAHFKVISIDTREGQQLKDFGGFAAVLRYAIH